MNGTNSTLKVLFGLIIMAFSLTLAYFAADYFKNLDDSKLDYWLVITLASGFYTAVGLVVAKIYPISFGFLFSADVLILHALGARFDGIPSIYKVGLVGVIIALLYVLALLKKEEPAQQTQ